MTPQGNSPPIIKRKKVVVGAGHHGGAWKVAYADFVTAMMAFFLLMWLLNATTEKQRRGIANYFNPTISATNNPGGGEGVFGGDSLTSETTATANGTGAPPMAELSEADRALEAAALEELEQALRAAGGESMTKELLLRHVVTRLTDEGLVVELFDLPESSLFEGESSLPRPVLRDLTKVVANVMARARNSVAVHGFVMSYPITLIENPVWRLSIERGQVVRGLLEQAGLPPARMQRVAGLADRVPAMADPMSPRNNRIEIILLRTLPPRRTLAGN